MSRVLLVSGDPSLREGVRGALAGGACELRCATDGRRGAAMLREEPADLIINDWTATASDAIESLKRLRFEYQNARRLAVVAGGIERAGMEAVERVALAVEPHVGFAQYLKTKKERMGHLIHAA